MGEINPREKRYASQHICLSTDDENVIKEFIKNTGRNTSLRRVFEVWWYYYDFNLLPANELAEDISNNIEKYRAILYGDSETTKCYSFRVSILNQLMATAEILKHTRRSVVEYYVKEMINDIRNENYTVDIFNENYKIWSYKLEGRGYYRLHVEMDSIIGSSLAKYCKSIDKSFGYLLNMWATEEHILQFIENVDVSALNTSNTVHYEVLLNEVTFGHVKSLVSPLRKKGMKPFRTGITLKNQLDTYSAIVSLMLYEVAIKLDIVSRKQVKMIGVKENV